MLTHYRLRTSSRQGMAAGRRHPRRPRETRASKGKRRVPIRETEARMMAKARETKRKMRARTKVMPRRTRKNEHT